MGSHTIRQNIKLNDMYAQGGQRGKSFFADVEYEFLQYISNTTADGKTLFIEVMPVANCYDNNWSQYLGGGLTGPVVVSSVQAMQAVI